MDELILQSLKLKFQIVSRNNNFEKINNDGRIFKTYSLML